MRKCCWPTARGCRRIDLYTAYGEPADDETRTTFRELVRRRAAGTPVAYLVGHREFYSLEFRSHAGCTDSAAGDGACSSSRCLDHVKATRSSGRDAVIEIADVGTGSGILGRVCGEVCAEVARDGDRHQPGGTRRRPTKRRATWCADRIEFVESNLLSPNRRSRDSTTS